MPCATDWRSRYSHGAKNSPPPSIPASARSRPAAPTRSRLPARPKSDQTGWAGPPSTIDLSEHDIERAEDGRDIGQQMALADKIHCLQMRKTRRADLAFVRLVAAIGDQIDAELALRRLDRGVDLAGWHVKAFGVELEVMDQRLHRALHLSPARRENLVILNRNRSLPVG